MRTHNVPKDDQSEDSVMFYSLYHLCSSGRDRSSSWICISETDIQQNVNEETETSTQRVSLGWILPPEVCCRYLGLVFLVKTLSLLSQLLFVHPCPRQLNFDFVSVLKSPLVYSPWGSSSVVALYTQGPGFHHHSALPETSPIVLQPVYLLFFFKTQRWTRFAWLPWRS